MCKVCTLTLIQHFDSASHPIFFFGFSDTHVSCFPFVIVTVIDTSAFVQFQI